MRLLLTTAALTVALTAPATAEVRWPSGTTARPFSEWARASAMPLPPGDVKVIIGPCPISGLPSSSACTDRGMPIYLEPSRLTGQMREVFLHELGHQFDYRVLTDADRQLMGVMMGAPRGRWFNGGEASGAEWFAEAYATCASRRMMRRAAKHPRDLLWMRYDWQAEPWRVAAVCALIRRAARR